MIAATEKVTLKNGEEVDFSILRAPDEQWADALMGLIGHKGEIWNWQNKEALTKPLGLEISYYFLHRNGKGFSNVTSSELNGVGLFGHVWTDTEERRKGACAAIMERQMADFHDRGGRFLSLGTGYDTTPYRIYKKFGFQGLEANNGYMVYYRDTREAFEEEYFAACEAVIEPIDWKHWPGAGALFVTDVPGFIRGAPIGAYGLSSAESPLIPLLMDRYKAEPPVIRGQALVNPDTQAVVGVAEWGYDRTWRGTVVVDVFCHPNFWDRGADLLNALALPGDADQYAAYVDAACPRKQEALEAAGFEVAGRLSNWVRRNYHEDARQDVTALVKRRR